MKTAVSIPDPVFRSAERLARRLGVSRSRLYSEAVASYVAQRSAAEVTAALNSIYGQGGERARLDPVLASLQFRALPREDW